MAAVVANVAPAEDVVRAIKTSADAYTAGSDRMNVSIPVEADSPVVVEGSQTFTPLAIALPDLKGTDRARQAKDGTLVYSTDESVDLAVQPLEGGARVLTVLNDHDGAESFEYTFGDSDNTFVALLEDGSAEVIVDRGDNSSEVIGVIAAPWANDATGTNVPTWYEVQGNVLTQVVDHQGGDYAYPITADPKVSLGWTGTYYHFNRAETKTLAQYGVPGTVALVAGCAAIGTIGTPVGTVILGAACAVYGAPFFFNAGVAQNSKPKKCVYLRHSGAIFTSGTYKDSRCV